jgi:hypothetical protein
VFCGKLELDAKSLGEPFGLGHLHQNYEATIGEIPGVKVEDCDGIAQDTEYE